MPDFVHLHSHTEFSLLDGLSKIKKLVPLVKDMGMPALAITDHGNMCGVVDFYKKCKDAGIKPILGCEVYYTPQSRFERSGNDRKINHQILLAKDFEGYKNLMRLVSVGWLEGYYYKPRIDWEALVKYSQGLIATSSCLAGVVPQLLIKDQFDLAKKEILKFRELFKDDFYLELQRHPNIKELEPVNQALIRLGRDLSIPVIATNDAHYLKKEDAFAQDVLLMINTQTTINDKDRLTMMDSPDFYIKSPEEMAEEFADIPEALSNTLKVAEKCNVELDLGKWYFPNFILPEGETNESYLKKKVLQNARDHYQTITKEIQERLDMELEVICSRGFAPYFLIMQDFILWAEANDMATNTRGSAAGSLVSFVLGITTVDPLIYGLPFERFLNMFRPTPPDIDLDVADNKRQQMLHHIIDQYGEDNVAQICTFGKMLSRQSVRDVARVLGYEYEVGDKISKLIPPPKQGFPVSIPKALKEVSELKAIYDSDPDTKRILDVAMQVEDTARHISVHASGVVIAPRPITDFTAVQREADGDKKITQLEMKACEEVGLIKFDILGLDNLSILGDAVVKIKNRHKIPLNIRKIPLNDEKTFAMLSRGETEGVFQLSSGGMTKYVKDLKPTRVDDLMAMVALYRPGPMAVIPEYIQRKNDPAKVKYLDPRMEKYLSKSFGLLVYQDDLLFSAIYLAGYSWEEADKFRKAVGKKIPEEMAKQKDKFTEGVIKNGQTKEFAETLWQLFEPFQSYGFNKAHAAAYGMLAYQTAYLKANYPVDYMCAYLAAKSDNIDEVGNGIEECRRMGIFIAPPDINKSNIDFDIEPNPDSLEGHSVRFGLSAIKNVGHAAIDVIIKERQENGEFQNFTDFIMRVDGKKVNKKTLESLIRVGAFDAFGERAAILASIEKIRQEADRLIGKHDRNQFGLFDNPQQTKQKSAIAPIDKFEVVVPLSEKDKLSLEKELLGVFISENPLSKLLAPFQGITLDLAADMSSKTNETKVKLAAVITRIRSVVTKKNNSKMAFLTLEDRSGTVSAVVFPKLFAEVSANLSENKAYFIEGKVNLRNDELSIVIDKIQETAPSFLPKYDFTIIVPKGTTQVQLLELNALLKQNPDSKKGIILLPNGKQVILGYGVNYTFELESKINSILKIALN